MFIQTQETPNPESLMFLPGHDVVGEEDPIFFHKTDTCEQCPLARRLLDLSGVTNVFLGRDFITITKEKTFDWYVLKPHVLGLLMEHFINKMPLLVTVFKNVSHTDNHFSAMASGNPLIQQIQEIIETRVRPAVAQDGGDIVFHSFVEGVVFLEMKGACSGCPSSTVTLKSGIENMLKFYVPEVLEVRQVDDVA